MNGLVQNTHGLMFLTNFILSNTVGQKVKCSPVCFKYTSHSFSPPFIRMYQDAILWNLGSTGINGKQSSVNNEILS